ncbi:hypothetical protein EYC80_007171 [Monilinia laxa]|uniref:Uncharacterized protein n=1 Tax=Monilinia laxa TaxID=61186 RepID=A0A5N6K0G5_MONLA|nr:hypothetical protein EYC80_007171 [Monilinia laxa]
MAAWRSTGIVMLFDCGTKNLLWYKAGSKEEVSEKEPCLIYMKVMYLHVRQTIESSRNSRPRICIQLILILSNPYKSLCPSQNKDSLMTCWFSYKRNNR